MKRGGNWGNKSHRGSKAAREIVEAATPRLARILVKMAETGKDRFGKAMTVQDHVRCLTAALDRGKVAPRKEPVPIGGDEPAVGIEVTTVQGEAKAG